MVHKLIRQGIWHVHIAGGFKAVVVVPQEALYIIDTHTHIYIGIRLRNSSPNRVSEYIWLVRYI